ncbi:Lead, cadmium, zinc and mercury transporting ATPase [Helicobacter bizzozeronii CCUG 35545]|nr:Lead, cadmium, zinc and mercury transporting ATPase [Helicobacter bizzozeronii CCUG 35545]
MKRAHFYIEGMTCSSCSSGIERSLGRKKFIQEIGVDLISKKSLCAL